MARLLELYRPAPHRSRSGSTLVVLPAAVRATLLAGTPAGRVPLRARPKTRRACARRTAVAWPRG